MSDGCGGGPASKSEIAGAMGVLRDLWSADGRTEADIMGAMPGGRSCKETSVLGIKGMEDAGMAHSLREDWRRQLASEGKSRVNSRSVGAEFLDQIANQAGRQ
jgi:hypothetical protein